MFVLYVLFPESQTCAIFLGMVRVCVCVCMRREGAECICSVASVQRCVCVNAQEVVMGFVREYVDITQ